MAKHDHRSKIMLSTASLIRWFGRQISRWFFVLLFVAALALNVATVTSMAAFNMVSSLVSEAWSTADLVRGRHSAEIEQERIGRRAAEAEVTRVTRALEIAEADLSTARRGVVTFRGSTMPQNEMIDAVISGVERRTALGAARNVTAAAGEAIPVWGIAVIVGVTGLELRDACENMRDLEDMRRALSLITTTIPDEQTAAREVCGQVVPSGAEIWQVILDSPHEVWESIRSYGVALPEITMPQWFLNWLEGARGLVGYEQNQ